MGNREPLAEWKPRPYGGAAALDVDGLMFLEAEPDGNWYIGFEGKDGCVQPSLAPVQLAAEDAARDMVAAMAAALGGSVAWDEGVDDGNA